MQSKFVKAFIAFAVVTAIGTGVAFAQTPSNGLQVKVQPALFEQVVNPGDSFSTSITVTNPQATANQFSVGIQDVSDINQAGEPVFSSTSVPEYGLSSWVSISKPTITVPAHRSVVVPFTITVPRTATPGGHYGALFLSYGATRPLLTGTGVGYQVGALIDLRIAGDAKEQAEVREFSTDKGLYQSPVVSFTARVADQGNVLLRPRGPIDITNMFGQKVGTIIMNDENSAVFPGAERSYTATWTGNGFMIGRFDAVMSLSYGNNGNKTVSATTSFWVIPVIPILAVLASIIFFIAVFIWSIRAYVRKRVNSMVSGGRQERGISEEEKLLMSSRLPFSRLLFIVIATILFAVVFLIVLFFFFG